MNLENLEPRRLHADAKDQRFSMFDVDDSAFNSVNVNGSAACQCLDTLQGPRLQGSFNAWQCLEAALASSSVVPLQHHHPTPRRPLYTTAFSAPNLGFTFCGLHYELNPCPRAVFTFDQAFSRRWPIMPGFDFSNYNRNLALHAKGVPLPKATSTGTTIVGCIYNGGVVVCNPLLASFRASN